MPFSVSDEALEGLDALDPDGRTKVLSDMTDEQRAQVAAAVPPWKAKKTPAIPSAEIAPTPFPSGADQPETPFPTVAAKPLPPSPITEGLSKGLTYLQDASTKVAAWDAAAGSSSNKFLGGLQAIGTAGQMGLNPFINQERMQAEPVVQQNALQLEEAVKPVAGKQAANVAGTIQGVANLGGMAAMGAAIPELGIGGEFGHPATQFISNTLKNVAGIGAFSVAGAPEGQRLDAFKQTVTDPKALLLSALGARLQMRPSEVFRAVRPEEEKVAVKSEETVNGRPAKASIQLAPEQTESMLAEVAAHPEAAPLEKTVAIKRGASPEEVAFQQELDAPFKKGSDIKKTGPFEPSAAVARTSLQGTPELVMFGSRGETHAIESFDLTRPEKVAEAAKHLQKANLGLPFSAADVTLPEETWFALQPHKTPAQVLEELSHPQSAVFTVDPGNTNTIVTRADTQEGAFHKASSRNIALVHDGEGWKYGMQLGLENGREWAAPIEERGPSVGVVGPVDAIKPLLPGDMAAFQHGELPARVAEFSTPRAAKAIERVDTPSTRAETVASSKPSGLEKTVLSRRESAPMAAGAPSPGVPPSAPPGGKPPPAPPPPPERVPYPGIPKPDHVPETSAADIVFAHSLAKAGILEQAARQLVNPGLRGPDYLRQYVQQNASLAALGRVRDELVTQFRKQYGIKARSLVDNDLGKMVAGKMDPVVFQKRHPEFYNSFHDSVDSFMAEVQKNEADLRELGALAADPAIARETGELYKTREFHNWSRGPKEWGKILQRNSSMMNAAAESAKEWWPDKWVKEQAPDATPSVWRATKLLELLSTENPITAASQAPKAANALKARLDLPEWYRTLLGEETSGIYSMAATLSKQVELKARFTMYREMAADPRVSVANPTDEQVAAGWRQIASGTNQLWGDLAGRWVAPYINDFIVQAPLTQKVGSDLARTLLQIQKSHQTSMGGLTAYVNDALSQFWQATMSGALKPMDPRSYAQFGKAQLQAIEALRAHKAGPLAEGTSQQLIRDARRLGVDAPGYGASETMGQDSALLELQKHFNAQPEGLARIIAPPARGYMKVQRIAGHAMDWYPRVQKLAAWQVLTDRAIQNPSLLQGLESIPGATPREKAMRWAADKVLKGFYTPDRVSPALDTLRKGPMAFLLNKYMTWKGDMLVKHGLLPKRLLEEPDLQSSMMQAGAVALLALTAISKQEPLTKDMKAAAVAAGPQGQRQFKNTDSLIPIRMADGKLALIDPGPLLEPLQYFAGDPSMPWYGRFADNMTLGWTDNGFLGTPTRMLAANIVDRRLAPPDAKKPGPDNTVWDAIDWAWKDLGLAPGALPKEYQALKQSGALGNDVGFRQDTTSPGFTAAKMAGLPVQSFNPAGNASTGAILRDSGDVYSLIRAYKSRAGMPPEQAQGMVKEMVNAVGGITRPEEQKRALEAIMAAINESAGKMGRDAQLFGKVRQGQQGGTK